MSRPRSRLLLAAPVAAAAAALAWYAWPVRNGGAAPFPGMVRTTETRIAPEIGGRMQGFLVAPGQSVQRGQPLASIVNPELFAAVDAARAQVDKARSDRDRVYAGLRAEQVQMLERDIGKAEAVHTQDVQELGRKSVLAAHSFASQQDLDIARAAEARSAADIAVARAHYAEAERGPTGEERALADAVVAEAEAARDTVEARAAKMLMRAPASGTIATLVVQPGEAVVPGEPILTMTPDQGLWFGFNLREDALRGVPFGAAIALRTSSGEALPARVVELRDWGEFAVWRAARAAGDHDLNTFFVRADPTGPVTNLSPGETVWLPHMRER